MYSFEKWRVAITLQVSQGSATVWKSGTEIWIWILIQIFWLQVLKRFLCFNPKNLSETIIKKFWSWFIRSELVGRIRIQLVQWKKNQFLIQVSVTTRLNSWFYFPLLLLIHSKNWRLDYHGKVGNDRREWFINLY